MTFQLIANGQELAALEAPWRQLAGGYPFLSWEWLNTWWNYYGTGERELHVVAIFGEAQNGSRPQLLGIAPWYLDRTLVDGNVLRWLGSGSVCTDHLSLICRPEHRDQVADAVADALTTGCDEWDRLDLDAVDAGDQSIARLVAVLEERDCLVSRHEGDSCWSLDLPPTWDDYLAAVSKSHRKQLRQLERRVLESPRVKWYRVASQADFESAWPVLVDLHQRRRQSLNEPGCFASRAFHDFHRDVAAQLLDRGQLRLSWLELDGTPAAAEYHLADRGATYAYQGGVDPLRLAEEPGRLSTILCLRRAIDEGHQQFDFLRGNEPYKAHWRATSQPTYEYRVIPNRRLARLRGRVLTLTDTLREWARQKDN